MRKHVGVVEVPPAQYVRKGTCIHAAPRMMLAYVAVGCKIFSLEREKMTNHLLSLLLDFVCLTFSGTC